MPMYEYRCPDNGRVVEVIHGIAQRVSTWGLLCKLAEIPMGDTSANAPVERLISAPGLSFPKTDTELKNMGFTKLVKREKGVYENVTANDGDKRFMRADDPGSVPDFSKTIAD